MDYYISNNPLVREKIRENLVFADTFGDVLTAARDMVHKGHKLITHPLSGSIKPGETPYKTIIMSGKTDILDTDSLRIIEECILTARKFINKNRQLNEKQINDFQLIDYTLIFGKTGG